MRGGWDAGTTTVLIVTAASASEPYLPPLDARRGGRCGVRGGGLSRLRAAEERQHAQVAVQRVAQLSPAALLRVP